MHFQRFFMVPFKELFIVIMIIVTDDCRGDKLVHSPNTEKVTKREILTYTISRKKIIKYFILNQKKKIEKKSYLGLLSFIVGSSPILRYPFYMSNLSVIVVFNSTIHFSEERNHVGGKEKPHYLCTILVL